MTEKLRNGAEVFRARNDPRQGNRVVLAFWQENGNHPWVTWRADREGNAYWGHYFKTREEAITDFVTR